MKWIYPNLGPAGTVFLGHEPQSNSNQYNFDCWKQILHDPSKEPSQGRLLKEVAMDPRVKQIFIMESPDKKLPQFVLVNIWDEKFRIDYVFLPNGQLAAHAVRI